VAKPAQQSADGVAVPDRTAAPSRYVALIELNRNRRGSGDPVRDQIADQRAQLGGEAFTPSARATRPYHAIKPRLLAPHHFQYRFGSPASTARCRYSEESELQGELGRIVMAGAYERFNNEHDSSPIFRCCLPELLKIAAKTFTVVAQITPYDATGAPSAPSRIEFGIRSLHSLSNRGFAPIFTVPSAYSALIEFSRDQMRREPLLD
jgi:hypothetical protein